MPARYRSPLLLLPLLLAISVVPPALAVPNDVDIDGDPTTTGGLPDWDVINSGGGSAMQFTGLHVDPSGGTIFSSLTSQDTAPVSGWVWEDGPVVGYADLLNAMAAGYNGDRFYFAVDRSATNNDGTYGVWLLETDLSLSPGGSFIGTHSPQDVLLVINASTFAIDVQAYQWVGGAPGISPLPVPPGAVEVATNDVAVGSPWPHSGLETCSPPSGFTGCLPAYSFMEGGVDLTTLGVTGCYRTVLVETRSSQSSSAYLRDFMILPLNPPCEPVAVEPSTWGAIKKQYR